MDSIDLENLKLETDAPRDLVYMESPQPEEEWLDPDWLGKRLTAPPDQVRSKKHRPDAICLYRVRNSLILPRSIVIDAKSELIKQESAFRNNMSPTIFHGALVKRNGTYSYKGKVGNSDVKEVPKPIYSLDTDWPGAFGHVFLDCLPRAWAVNRAPADVELVSSAKHIKLLNEFLRLLRVKKRVRKLVTPVLAPEAYMADSSIDRKGWIHSAGFEMITRIKETAKKRYEGSWSLPRRIYVSRARTSGRKLSNEPEVERIFEASGLAIVHPETIPLVEQIVLFMNANHVAGPGGSGMHMSLFCNSGCVVGVISSPSWFFNADIVCSQATRIRLVHIVGMQTPEVHQRSQGDFFVDTADVKAFINRYC